MAALLSVQWQIDKELRRRELVEERIGGLRDLPPGHPHLGERRGAHRAARREVSLDVLAQHDPLGTVQEIALLLPREVADDPTDRVHLPEMPRPGGLAHSFEPAQPLAAGESELVNERMPSPRGLARPRASGSWCGLPTDFSRRHHRL